jgi:hypothetical protein
MTVNKLKKSGFPFRLTIRLLLIWIIVSGGIAAWSQNFISGYVKEEESGEPLIGASVFIPGTTIGVSTNGAGFFVIKLPGNDTIALMATYIGYQPMRKKINSVREKQTDFYLKKGLELEEIKVKAPLAAENRFGSNIIEIPTTELKALPALGGQTDLIRTYQFLPGVQGGTEGKAGMYVRGRGFLPHWSFLKISD